MSAQEGKGQGLEQELTGKQADPSAVKEFWLQTVRPLADRGGLDKIKSIPATTPRLRDVARTQNYCLTRKNFAGAGDRYDLIDWWNRRGKSA